MAEYVAKCLKASQLTLSHCIVKKGREDVARGVVGEGVALAYDIHELEPLPDLVVDCAGHEGLRAHGAACLRKGVPVVSASLGALADSKTFRQLELAARAGGTQLQLASGAIGALDALSAAKVGGLDKVRYTGIKPPESWRGTPAEVAVALETLEQPFTHFSGSAREAAQRYPKNANVAAAVALAGMGFDKTQARLIADPNACGNTHLLHASGAFGAFEFTITGKSLPDTPRTSALAAMSIVERIRRRTSAIVV